MTSVVRAPSRRVVALRAARRSAQLALLVLGVLLVAHGLGGPPLASRNLSTLGVWVYYRGFLLIVLLAAGNFFCMACPMMLVRDIARRWWTPSRAWPPALRNKWLSIALLTAVLFGYELFDWWNDPVATAFLILGLFGAALLVDLTFQRASFCQFVCPVGQFSFVASTLSPLEVRIRTPDRCAACETRDCIGPAEPGKPRGCELGLFQPRKQGNLDCTFCLDCVAACPHDNVELATRLPAEELWLSGFRSGVGRLSRRPDIATLITVMVFAGLLNAFGMVSPVYALHDLAARIGVESEAGFLAALFLVGVVIEPIVLVGLTALAARRGLARSEPLLGFAIRYVPCLAPIGVAVWMAHHAFHLLTGFWTFLPVVQREASSLGLQILGKPIYLSGLPESAVYLLELALLFGGLVGSLCVAWNIAAQERGSRAVRLFAPWGVLALLLCAAALWTLSQPMEMRGTMPQ